jgi:enamine deaminase RidA (YjgF/YER057c/UK114 family)
MKNSFLNTVLFAALIQTVAGADGFGPKASGISFHHLPGDSTFSSATKVTGRALAHTAQFLAFPDDHSRRKSASVAMQAADVLQRLNLALRSAGTTLRRSVKLNICLAKESDRDAVSEAVGRVIGTAHPAVCFVAGSLTLEGALVAMDAVAVVPGQTYVPRRLKTREGLKSGHIGAHAAVLSSGRSIYVSGQAVRGTNVVDAARKTMEQLEGTLRYLDLKWQDVVQVKSFLNPVSQAGEVAQIIGEFFGDATPPQVFVEWTYKERIEIELIVDGGPMKPGLPRIDYLTPTGMTASPVFCRVTRINDGPLVYVSGISGGAGGMTTAEVFSRLKYVLKFAGSDLRHLVKATYYVSDADSSKELNAYRPKVYDPLRPPAASKAPVRSVGIADSNMTLDMIAVGLPY